MDPFDPLLVQFNDITAVHGMHEISLETAQYHVHASKQKASEGMPGYVNEGLDLLSAAQCIALPLVDIRERATTGFSRPQDQLHYNTLSIAVEHARTILEPHRIPPTDFSSVLSLQVMVDAHDMMLENGMDQCAFMCAEDATNNRSFAVSLRDLETSIICATKAAMIMCKKNGPLEHTVS